MKKLIVVALLSAVAPFARCLADGTEGLGEPSIPIQPGSGVLLAGGGLTLTPTQPGLLQFTVPPELTIKQVLLYWSGVADPLFLPVNNPAFPQKYDVVVTASGGSATTVTGNLIGGPTTVFDKMNLTYRADITSTGLVRAGPNLISVAFPQLLTNVDHGVGIAVIYQESSGPAPLFIRDGDDYAYIGFAGEMGRTKPQVFQIERSANERQALLTLLVSGIEKPAPGLEGVRPNSIQITTGIAGKDSVKSYSDVLISASGPMMDAVAIPLTLPAGTDQVTVQLFSRDDFNGSLGSRNPSSFTWDMAALSVSQSGFVPCPQVSLATDIDKFQQSLNGQIARQKTIIRKITKKGCGRTTVGAQLLKQQQKRANKLIKANQNIIASLPPVTVVCTGESSTGLNQFKVNGFNKNAKGLDTIYAKLVRFNKSCQRSGARR